MSKLHMKVRISDIASRAGVSTGTVDRVIHERGEVAPGTRERVLDIIREMNYEPDILARTLASKKNFQFASLIPGAGNNSMFWAGPALGINRALERVHPFGVTHQYFLFDYFERESFRKAADLLLKTKPDGIILAPVFSGLATGFISECVKRNIPLVLINANVEDSPVLSFVGQDPFSSGMVAARLLDYGLPEEATIYIINIKSAKGNNTHLLHRETGFRHYFSGRYSGSRQIKTINACDKNLSVLEKEWLKSMKEKPQKNGVSGLFVTNSRVFLVADWLQSMGEQHHRLVGYDLLDANITHLGNDVIDFLISQKPEEQGYRSMMSLFDSLVLKRNVAFSQYLPIDIITKENIAYYLQKDGLI